MNKTVAEIADLVGGTVIGDTDTPINGINGIRHAQAGELTFLADRRYAAYLGSTKASAVLVSPEISQSDKALIQVPAPYVAMAAILKQIQRESARHPKGIHETATVSESARLGANVTLGPHVYVGENTVIDSNTIIYPNVYIGAGCRIGKGCLIYPNATLREDTVVGERCTIHSGAVLGSDGFGFANMDGRHEKIPQVGQVVVGDDVEIGANTAIDRATFGQTVIGNGTKIDNLVQIGHNTRIGKDTVICGNAGIAGSAIIGDRVTIAAGAGIGGHLEVGDGAVVAGYSGVSKSVKPGQSVFGFPAVEHARAKRMYAALRQLPDVLRQMRTLTERVAELEGQLHDQTEDDS